MEIAVFVHAQSVARGQHRDAVGPFDDRRPANFSHGAQQRLTIDGGHVYTLLIEIHATPPLQSSAFLAVPLLESGRLRLLDSREGSKMVADELDGIAEPVGILPPVVRLEGIRDFRKRFGCLTSRWQGGWY